MDELIGWGLQLVQRVQALGPAFDEPMEFFTFLGTVEFYLLLLPLIYWNLNPHIGFRLLIILICTDAISSGFKHLLRQPRPYWLGGVSGKSFESSYGIPSAHASDSLSVWGYLAYRYRQVGLWILAVFLIFFIALSRVYLGVHFPHDIVAGWLIGLIVLILFPTVERQIKRRQGASTLGVQISAALVISSTIAILGIGIGAITASMVDPQAWASFATHARSLTHYFTLAGACFGAITGYAILFRKFDYVVTAAWYQQILRYILGIIGVFLIWQGLDGAFSALAPDESPVGYVLRFVRYGGTTLWAMLGAPWLFIQLRLAVRPAAAHSEDF